MIKEQLQAIREEALKAVTDSADMKEIDALRVKFLGKKGELTAILKQMGGLSAEERPVIGQMANEIRADIENAVKDKTGSLKAALTDLRLKTETVDVTMPGKRKLIAKRHPMNIVLDDLKSIFHGMGYTVVDGPEIEDTKHCFDMLNTLEGHPARDPNDTFYINDDVLLRTQTSSVQIRTMLKQKPPIAIISPGRVYRRDEVDGTHSPIFHQCEGLVIDKGITFSNLKGTLTQFVQKLFGKETKVKFRPHHFPFTEPSAEMDVSCFKCGGKGCRFCKGEGWIEILGCGMVHPRVLRMSGIDPEEYSGFAFGIGLERITLLKYEIDDMRLLYENDDRFLKQF